MVAQERPHRLPLHSSRATRRPVPKVGQRFRSGGTPSGQPELETAHQWSKDGRFLVYSENGQKTNWDLFVLPMGPDAGASRKPDIFLQTEFNEAFGQLSPDSHWMAYTSDKSGSNEVYVRPFPKAEGEWKISLSGGEQPRWRGANFSTWQRMER
jgi:Tol biopolymer transport system component